MAESSQTARKTRRGSIDSLPPCKSITKKNTLTVLLFYNIEYVQFRNVNQIK